MWFCFKQLTPEESVRKEQRRERNKVAAAKCRQRRVDQTNVLINVSIKFHFSILQWDRNYILCVMQSYYLKMNRQNSVANNAYGTHFLKLE